MNDDELSNPAAISTFLKGTCNIDLQVLPEQQYAWLAKTLKQTWYFKLCKKDKAPVLEYMRRMTGYSRQHLTRLIAQYRKNKCIGNKYPQRNSFTKFYTREDILLLAITDEHHGTLSGGITKKLEVVSSVEKISENWLIPVLENILKTFPFVIINCHADNGSEYINHTVARLLNKLNIELTKTRPRHSNDNALAESKNGSIIRKHLGYMHIPQQWAPKVNKFNNLSSTKFTKLESGYKPYT